MIGAFILQLVVAFEHAYFFYLEFFLWEQEKTAKVFRSTVERQQQTSQLAKNMGLYNLFLTGGILFSLYLSNVQFQYYFLACVFVAGVVGAFTVTKRIFYIQGTPALVALILLYLGF